MKKALIITIGTGPSVYESIAFAISQNNPNLVVFCHTSKSKINVDNAIELAGIDKEKTVCKLCDSFDDFDLLYQEYARYIDELISAGYRPNEIVADYTTGSRPMSVALVIASLKKQVGFISYVTGKRDIKTGIAADSEKSIAFKPSLLYSENYVQLAKEFFNLMQYGSAAALLKRHPIHPDCKMEADWIITISEAYYNWDKFKFEEAFNLLRTLNKDISAKNNIGPKIQAYCGMLKKLAGTVNVYNKARELKATAEEINELDNTIVYDLINNAFRRYKEFKYDDGVARLYRAVEAAAQLVFLKKTGLSTSKIPFDRLPEALKDKWADVRQTRGYIDLALEQTIASLNILDEPLGKLYSSQENEWRKLSSMRNHSILAHGFASVDKTQFEKYYEMVKEFLPDYQETEWLTLQ